ncbi:hypothetical protein DL768_008546 [Monosporascus sp. mg162]|nr:hypothetical protein DL768_008546 [Monosporascus sp. mg162]
MINDTVKDAPQAVTQFYELEYQLAPTSNKCTQIPREARLELGRATSQKCRLDEGRRGSFAARDNHYEVIMFGAMMMLVAATVKDDNINHLRELVPAVKRNDLLMNPTEGGECFRGPGKKIQYLAALDNYQSGLSRDFGKPSCHACGRTDVDGKGLKRCGGCHNKMGAAWFCDKVDFSESYDKEG